MKLYSFFNSSTSYRIRIVVALKGLTCEIVPVDIRQNAHRDPAYVALNPSANVPLLIDGDVTLGQSFAIADYLDAAYPEPPLIPASGRHRADVLEFVSMIGGDIHPVNNLRVLRYLQAELGASDTQKNTWYAHWIDEGLQAAERLLTRQAGAPFAFGDEPTLADCWLVPQVANALRMKCDTAAYGRVMSVYRHCTGLPAFQAAAPDRQPDFGS